jgi:hypothetical protein
MFMRPSFCYSFASPTVKRLSVTDRNRPMLALMQLACQRYDTLPMNTEYTEF